MPKLQPFSHQNSKDLHTSYFRPNWQISTPHLSFNGNLIMSFISILTVGTLRKIARMCRVANCLKGDIDFYKGPFFQVGQFMFL